MAELPSLRHARPALAGLRFRTTTFAVLVVGLVMVLSVVALRLVAEARVEASITDSVDARTRDIELLVVANGLEDRLAGRGGERFAQVVDKTGTVIAFSAGLDGMAPIIADHLEPGESVVVKLDELLEEDETAEEDARDDDDGDVDGPIVIVARGAQSPDGPVTIISGASLEPAQAALGVLGTLLWAGFPIVLLIVGGVVWYLTGRALRPIEAMRREAASISASELGRRLPEPESRDEVHRLAATLNGMLDRLEAAAERQHQFVADASHELKTPVAAVRTMLEVASADPEFSEWQVLLDDLGRENRRSEELVRDLLMLAAVDEGQMTPRRIDVDLDGVVGRQAELLRRRSSLRVDTSGLTPARIVGDPEALARLVRNLIDNAERHAETAVWLATWVDEAGSAVIEVSDDGPGIEAEDRERVFDRFVRLDEDRSRSAGGTGLGLAVARAVARSHGGEVTVVEPRRDGATMEVRVPSGA